MIPLPVQPAGLPSGSFGGRRTGRGACWQWRRLLAAPHRVAFWGGGVVLAASALWWAAMLVARAAGVLMPWAVSPGTAHALLMAFGFLPLFMAGFMFSAGPRWLGLEAVPGRLLALPVAVMLGGWAVALAGFHLSAPLAGLGVAAAAVGFALVTGLFGLMVLASRAQDRDHAKLVLLGCGIAVVAQWAAAVLLVLGLEAGARAAVHLALWGGLGLVSVALAHRMIPTFTPGAQPMQSAWRPRALLGVLAWLMLLQAPFAAAEALAGGTLPVAPAALRAAIELPGGALLLWLSLRWGLRPCLSVRLSLPRPMRLLAMLHLGFFWLGVALTLGGVSHALMSLSGGTESLALAPLYAFTMGCLGSLLLALATGVARGQSGRAVLADNWVWMMFWALQVAVAARVAAALWPAAGVPLTLLAAQFWLAAAGAWALRHGPWFGRPRPDGGAG
jgi:uncharacterized protein involved in response to NO